MGKGTSVVVSICGIIIFLIGLAFLFGMLASNMLLIIAGPYLVAAILLMAMGVYVMSKGHKKWKEATEQKKRISI
jgi:uncharacterized membrane protein YiaA